MPVGTLELVFTTRYKVKKFAHRPGYNYSQNKISRAFTARLDNIRTVADPAVFRKLLKSRYASFSFCYL